MDVAINSKGDVATPTRDPVTLWLLTVAVLIVVMVLVGGFVRLSRAGLSIVIARVRRTFSKDAASLRR